MFTLASGGIYTAVMITTVSSLGGKKGRHLTDTYSRTGKRFRSQIPGLQPPHALTEVISPVPAEQNATCYLHASIGYPRVKPGFSDYQNTAVTNIEISS